MKQEAIDWVSKEYKARKVAECFYVEETHYFLYLYFFNDAELETRVEEGKRLCQEIKRHKKILPMGRILNQFAKENGVTIYLQLRNKPKSKLFCFPSASEIDVKEVFEKQPFCTSMDWNVAIH